LARVGPLPQCATPSTNQRNTHDVFVACRATGPAPIPDLATRSCDECDAPVWIEPPALVRITALGLRIVCVPCVDRRPPGAARIAPGALAFLQARRGHAKRERAERYLAWLNADTN
jgi:hypothetical protein